MESMNHFRERIEALEQRMEVMGAHTGTVEGRRWWRGIACVGLLLVCLVSLAHSGQAADFACAAGDVVSLIDAINQANANGEANTITLAAGTYTLTAVDNNTDGPNGLPSVTSTLTIRGQGSESTSIERNFGGMPPAFRLGHVAAAGNLALKGLTLRGGLTTGGGGGGIFSRGTLALTHTAVVNNNGDGGNLFNAAGGTVTIAYSTIANNVSGHDSGGLFNAAGGTVFITATTFAHNQADGSGAIFNAGTLVVTASTFLENEAGGTGAGAAIGNFARGTLVVINTTFARNMLFSFQGNGTALFNQGTVILTNSTLADNSAGGLSQGGSALFSAMGATTILQNTILARNTGEPISHDCGGPVISLGHNLIGDPTGCTIPLQPTDLTGDPGLDTFIDDGTPGNGHLPLLLTSQAIDAGNDAFCPPTDQLGESRVGPCDIGAIEFQGKPHKRH
jgi:hypothetical protein